MTPLELLDFIRLHEYAAEASLSASGPQAAVVGIVMTDDFEVFFDTLETSRKAQNLRRNPKVAFVIGGFNPGDGRTVQYEGIADEPSGVELSELKQVYFARFPDGTTREKWEGMTYFRVRPTWIRLSDFSQEPPLILQFGPEALGLAKAPLQPATGAEALT